MNDVLLRQDNASFDSWPGITEHRSTLFPRTHNITDLALSEFRLFEPMKEARERK